MSLQANGKIPTVAEYYAAMINSSVDLVREPKQCCPFHEEKTPSFSYDVRRERWRCFGKCHTGGDVYDMHRMHYHLNTREEAIRSLKSMCGVSNAPKLELAYDDYKVRDEQLYEEAIYQRCLLYANTVDRWLDLDYVMSKVPVESAELQQLLVKWGVVEAI